MKILIIDEDHNIRLALSDLLITNGYRVAIARSLEKASAELEIANPDPPAAVIVEPYDQGAIIEEIARAVPHLPVFIVTAVPSWAMAVRALEGGEGALARTYLSKEDPYLGDSLIRALGEQIKQIKRNGFRVDLETVEAYYQGKRLELRPQQIVIFAHLIRNTGRRVPYTEISLLFGEELSPKEARDRYKSALSTLRSTLERVAGRVVIDSGRHLGFMYISSRSVHPAENPIPVLN